MRHHAPATRRNRDPILAVLRQVLPPRGTVLEIASGTGEHAVYFARQFPALSWQPSDAGSLESIGAWRDWADLPNVLQPLSLDVTEHGWPLQRADAVFCANMLHISPWATCQGLFSGASRLLPAQAPLVIYGPFLRDGVPTAPSNRAFNADLRARDPAWGIRALGEVEAVGSDCGFSLSRVAEMPANNLILVFSKSVA